MTKHNGFNPNLAAIAEQRQQFERFQQQAAFDHNSRVVLAAHHGAMLLLGGFSPDKWADAGTIAACAKASFDQLLACEREFEAVAARHRAAAAAKAGASAAPVVSG